MEDNQATIEQERDLLTRFKATREHKEATDAIATQASKDHEAVKYELIKFLVDHGKPNLEYEGLGKVSLTNNFSATVVEENREAFFQFLQDNGYGAIIKQTIDYRVVSSTVRELLKDGVEIPEYVQQKEYANIQYRK